MMPAMTYKKSMLPFPDYGSLAYSYPSCAIVPANPPAFLAAGRIPAAGVPGGPGDCAPSMAVCPPGSQGLLSGPSKVMSGLAKLPFWRADLSTSDKTIKGASKPARLLCRLSAPRNDVMGRCPAVIAGAGACLAVSALQGEHRQRLMRGDEASAHDCSAPAGSRREARAFAAIRGCYSCRIPQFLFGLAPSVISSSPPSAIDSASILQSVMLSPFQLPSWM